VLRHAADSPKLTEQVEEQQYAPEHSVGRMEVFQAKPFRAQIVFQLRNPVLHIGPAIVVPPDLFGGQRQAGHQYPERVLRQIDQLAPHWRFEAANPLPAPPRTAAACSSSLA